MQSFQELRLPPALNRAIEALNYTTPTPIQAEALPIALQRHDLIGVAQTGTGKTGAFCIPTLVRLMEDRDATALILAPTREIAQQIDVLCQHFSKFVPEVRSALLIGGVAMQPQDRALARRPRILVATPGRLLDHLYRKKGLLSFTSILVLDEADRMLDMGFAPQLNQIRSFLPKGPRQTLLFSATWNSEVDALAKGYLRDPVRVTVGEMSRAAASVEQTVLHALVKTKNDLLLDEVNAREGTILIFTRTQTRTDRVARYLDSFGVEVGRIHGGRSQAQRNAALNGFRAGKIRVLVATDIASRGIDVADIGHVINYDLPQSPEDYVHRIGRTGRAGATGHALTILCPEDRGSWLDIVKLLRKSGSAVPETPFNEKQARGAHSAPRESRPAPRPHRHQRSQQNRPQRGPQGQPRSANPGRAQEPRRDGSPVQAFAPRPQGHQGNQGAQESSGGGSRNSKPWHSRKPKRSNFFERGAQDARRPI